MAKTAQQPVLVIMGVSGSGKSTVAGVLAGKLGWDLAEGDDLHPEANVAKMQSGLALSDEDRWPWLGIIRTGSGSARMPGLRQSLRARHSKRSTAMCSAAKTLFSSSCRGARTRSPTDWPPGMATSCRRRSWNRSSTPWKSPRRTRTTSPCAYRRHRPKKRTRSLNA
jgi:hypothetical protein